VRGGGLTGMALGMPAEGHPRGRITVCRAMRALSLETRENAQAEISRDWRASYKDSIDRKGVNKGRPDSLCRHKRGTNFMDCSMGDSGRDSSWGVTGGVSSQPLASPVAFTSAPLRAFISCPTA